MTPRRILIRRRAGVGKSTLCKQLVHDFIYAKQLEVLFSRLLWIPLRRPKQWSSTKYDLEELFLRIYFENHPDKKFLLRRYGMRSIWRAHVAPATCRIPYRSCSRSRVGDVCFSDEQVQKYIEANVIEASKREEIKVFLRSRKVVKSLVRILFQLDALCFTWKASQDTNGMSRPHTMTALYLDIELSLWPKDIYEWGIKRKEESSTMTRRQVWREVERPLSVLQALAFCGLCSDRTGLTASTAATAMIVSKSVFRMLCVEIVLSTVFGFYFAANYFVQNWKEGNKLKLVRLDSQGNRLVDPDVFFRRHKYEGRYHIKWRFVADLLDDKDEAEPFFDLIEEQPRDILGPGPQRLIMNCLSEVSAKRPLRSWHHENLLRWGLFKAVNWHEDKATTLFGHDEFPEQALPDVVRTTLPLLNDESKVMNGLFFPAHIIDKWLWQEGGSKLSVDKSLDKSIRRCRFLQDLVFHAFEDQYGGDARRARLIFSGSRPRFFGPLQDDSSNTQIERT
ncbi:hypothetical protein XA68_12341 [Ophiocordyceps unilateralis]|uniref:DUF7068 domain-containing protein n=1 Tax=Ophiocordyceps unilateralis TaxID=268505 RepID=A0A2A9PVA3_OPHUN|nr:hypothetical protein XA68_12341 [Ophiocordyceps unilateralis]